MMLVVSNKYHLKVYLGSHLGDHATLRMQTVVFERVNVVLFASRLRHRSLSALPGLGNQMVLFCFLTPVHAISG